MRLKNKIAVIVGAGIYVAIASVIDRAGDATPLSFLLAGIVAGLTGLCYAELASRFPEASGAAAYVMHGFGSNRLAQLTALALTVAIAIAAASIASGSVSYLSKLIGLSPTALTTLLVVGFTMLAMLGVRESASLSAAIGVLEVHRPLLELVGDDGSGGCRTRVCRVEEQFDVVFGPDADGGRVEVLDVVGPVELGLERGGVSARLAGRPEQVVHVVEEMRGGVAQWAVEDPLPVRRLQLRGPVVAGVVGLVTAPEDDSLHHP